MYTRENTKQIQIGTVRIGGGLPILIQSMTNTKTEDVEATVAQILALEKAGCDIVRVTVPTIEDAGYIDKIKENIDQNFISKFEIAAQNVIQYVMQSR